MYGKFITLTLIYLAAVVTLPAQETITNTDPFQSYKQGLLLFNKKLYHLSIQSFEQVLTDKASERISDAPDILRASEQKIILANLHLEKEESIKEADEFIANYYPNVLCKDVLFTLANLHYNRKDYKEAVSRYAMMETYSLPALAYSEVQFKKGYCHFVQKEFEYAKYHLTLVKDYRNSFFYPINYYLGMCHYFEENYEEAVKSFRLVENSDKYKPHTPYYISQIYFSQGEYERLLSYGEQKIAIPGTKKIAEIRLLLAQAYFKKKKFEDALPHFEYYEANARTLTKEEFYQIAFTQYQLKKYEDAASNFAELTELADKMGQVASYYLADCYLKTNNLSSARSAFRKVSTMNFSPSMQEEAQFNYGKLSSEQGFEREAINTLIDIPKNNRYYLEAQDIVSEIFLNGQDYVNAIRVLDKIEDKNKKLKGTYQKVNVFRGIQLFNDKEYDQALFYFKNSMTYPQNPRLEAEAKYWISYTLHEQENYSESMDRFEEYFVLSNGRKDLSQNTSEYLANYYQAYNYFKTDNFPFASRYFKKSISGIDQNRDYITNEYITYRVFSDANMRVADCAFKQNNYPEAKNYYQKTADLKQIGADYAWYQIGIIEGLQAKPYEKIITLEDMVKAYPGSAYADDAQFQLGETYLSIDRNVEAFRAFQKIILDYRGSSDLVNESYLKMGLISYNQGDADKAIEYYKRILDNNPSSKETTEAILALEEIFIDDLGQPDEYIAVLATIPGYEVDGFSRDSLNYMIGQIRFENGEYEKAIDGFAKYIELFPKGYFRVDANFKKGECHSILKQYKSGLRHYEFVINNGVSDYYEKALKKAAIISYNHEQNFYKSYKYYDKLAEYSLLPELLHESKLGALRSAFRIGNDGGTFKYAEAVRKDTLSTRDEKSAAFFYAGKTSYRQEKYTQALNAFASVTALSKNNQAAEASYLMADIYFKDKDFDKAEEQCNLTNSRHTRYPTWVAKSLLLLSDIYVVREDFFNARAALEAIIENFDGDKAIAGEANQKLQLVIQMQEDQNRIRAVDPQNLIELDTSSTSSGN